MQKLKLITVFFIFSTMTFNIDAQSMLKVSGGQTIIPLYSSYWITNNNPPQDAGVRLRMHAHTANQSAYIDYWQNLYFRTGNPGANITLTMGQYGMVGVNMYPFQRTVSGLDNWKFKLWVNGKVVSDAYVSYSDVSMKKNIVPITNGLTKVLQLNPIAYNYKADVIVGDSINEDSVTTSVENSYKRDDVTLHYGLTAQELETVCPNLVSNLGRCKGINYVELVPVLIKAIQEQQVTIENLKEEIVQWKGRSIDTPADKTRLFQNNPNPFDNSTTFSYFIDENIAISTAVIEVRNIMGILQSSLSLGDRSGIGQIEFNGGNLTQGYYIYTLKINGSIKDSKMFLKEN
jgi:hypothetical protein